jgi:hypothetical protein
MLIHITHAMCLTARPDEQGNMHLSYLVASDLVPAAVDDVEQQLGQVGACTCSHNRSSTGTSGKAQCQQDNSRYAAQSATVNGTERMHTRTLHNAVLLRLLPLDKACNRHIGSAIAA